MRCWLLLVILLFSVQSVLGATVSGVVYNSELKNVKNAVVTVNSVPEQKIVGGEYSFELAPGDYVIKARYFENGIFGYSTEENISIKDGGNYKLDLFMFIDIKDEEEVIKDIEEVGAELEKSKKPTYAYITLFVVLLILVFLIRMRKPQEDKDELDHVIELIKNDGGRMYQKDLRKKLGISEAKVSLMITELETKGKVEKIKKGRGNVIVLKK